MTDTDIEYNYISSATIKVYYMYINSILTKTHDIQTVRVN